MSSSNSIKNILADVQSAYEGGQEKTASDTEVDETPAQDNNVKEAKEGLNAQLQSLIGGQAQEKNASANDQNGDAVAHLEKMANDMAAADMRATVKEAHTFGAAVFDGFLARAQQYAGQGEKTASAQNSQHMSQQESQRMLKEASVAGYQSAANLLNRAANSQNQQAQRQKQAQEDDVRGTADAMEKLAELSDNCFRRGLQHMEKIAQSLQQHAQ